MGEHQNSSFSWKAVIYTAPLRQDVRCRACPSQDLLNRLLPRSVEIKARIGVDAESCWSDEESDFILQVVVSTSPALLNS